MLGIKLGDLMSVIDITYFQSYMRTRVFSGSENRDLVPNSEFSPKTFRFVPIFGTLVKIWPVYAFEFWKLKFWFKSYAFLQYFQFQDAQSQKMFWICSEFCLFWCFLLWKVTYIQKMFWIGSKFYTLWSFQLRNKPDFWYLNWKMF